MLLDQNHGMVFQKYYSSNGEYDYSFVGAIPQSIMALHQQLTVAPMGALLRYATHRTSGFAGAVEQIFLEGYLYTKSFVMLLNLAQGDALL